MVHTRSDDSFPLCGMKMIEQPFGGTASILNFTFTFIVDIMSNCCVSDFFGRILLKTSSFVEN